MPNENRSEHVAPEHNAEQPPEKHRASIHDTFIQKILSDPVHAAAQIKAVLPQEVADEIVWDTLELDTHRYVTNNLQNQYTDLVFKTTIRQHDLRIRLLLEHSSHAKPLELLQVLQYQLRQWERETEQKRLAGSKQRLTPIITIILHHSETGWRGRTRFIDYFGLDEQLARLLRPFVVDFGIVLDDISKVNTEALIARPVPPEVQLMLFALRYARAGRIILDELPKMATVITILRNDPYGRLVLGLFFVYIQRVCKISEAEMRTAFQEFIEPHLDPEMVAIWTQFDDGERKGKLEGELTRARSMLRRQLTQRFGPLSDAQLQRLDSASLEHLDAMTLRVLTAACIDEVLADP